MTSKSYDWDLKNRAKINPKMTKNCHFWTFNFLKTVHTIRANFSTVILHRIRVLYVQWHQSTNDNKVRNLFLKIFIRSPFTAHATLVQLFGKIEALHFFYFVTIRHDYYYYFATD